MAINEIDQEEISVIRTLECDFCLRFDSIMLAKSEILERVESNSLNIGSSIISHHDHQRIIYFDKFGDYLGDTISLNIKPISVESPSLIIPTLPRANNSRLRTIQKAMLGYLIQNSQNLAIVGPSFAGKTSLSIYLETGIPERYTKRINHSATMGKSVRRLKLGNTDLIIYDMGGQRDFWTSWKDAIENSDKVIFMIDGGAHNIKDIQDALLMTLNSRKSKSIRILILLNKIDLFFDGYIKDFTTIADFVMNFSKEDLENVWVVESSVYNGICYNYGGIKEEISLAKVIKEFLDV